MVVLTVPVVRALLCAFPQSDALAPGVYLALDSAALLVMGAAIVFGRVLGAGFGSITLSAVGIVLPLAALGALTDWLAGREVSDAMGLVGVLAIGVGLSVAAPARAERFERGLVAVLALCALLAGTKVATETRVAASVAWLVAPYWSAALLACALRPLRVRRAGAERADHRA